jgi:hypothetical protein
VIFVINLTLLLQDTHILQQQTQILSKHTQILQFFTPSTGRSCAQALSQLSSGLRPPNGEGPQIFKIYVYTISEIIENAH